MQLAGAALCGIFIFHEWATLECMSLGISALVLIVIGVLLTSREKRTRKQQTNSTVKGIILLFVSTLGYVSYIVHLQLFRIDGWSAIMPQATGMIAGALALSFNLQSSYCL